MKTIVNCKRCKDRDSCIKPCPALEAQLRKDFPLNIDVNASPRFAISPGIMSPELDIWKVIDDLSTDKTRRSPTYREKAILTLDAAGFDRKEIAKLFKIKRSSVRKVVYAAKQKLLRK